jgi:hypothetical protein
MLVHYQKISCSIVSRTFVLCLDYGSNIIRGWVQGGKRECNKRPRIESPCHRQHRIMDKGGIWLWRQRAGHEKKSLGSPVNSEKTVQDFDLIHSCVP